MFLSGDPRTLSAEVAKAAKPEPQVRLQRIADGDAGTRETLKIMADFARAAVRNPAQTIRQRAISLFSGIPPRQFTSEIRALQAFVRDQIRYMRDPYGVELVQTPEKTLELGVGDCDDKSTLLAALLMASGHPSQFVAIGFDAGGPFSHVLVETKVGNRWLPLETIINKEPGWFPSGVKRQYRRSI